MSQTFPRFRKLPAEVRLKIWGFFPEPRVIELHAPSADPDQDQDCWESSCRNHAGLSTCAEARNVALKFYTTTIPITGSDGARLYFDPIRDTPVILGQYDTSQLNRLFDTVRPRCVGLTAANLQPPFVRQTLPSWRRTLSPALEQLVVLQCAQEVPPAGFRGECKLEECDGINSFASYVVGADEQFRDATPGMRLMRLGFIPSNTPVSEHEVISSTKPCANVEISIRFDDRAETCRFGELEQWFKLLVSLSAMFERTLPRLEVCVATTEPRIPGPGILQIFSEAINARCITKVLDMWKLHNTGSSFELIKNENGLTIRQLGASNGMYVQNVTTKRGIYVHLFEPTGGYTVKTIERLLCPTNSATATVQIFGAWDNLDALNVL